MRSSDNDLFVRVLLSRYSLLVHRVALTVEMNNKREHSIPVRHLQLRVMRRLLISSYPLALVRFYNHDC